MRGADQERHRVVLQHHCVHGRNHQEELRLRHRGGWAVWRCRRGVTLGRLFEPSCLPAHAHVQGTPFADSISDVWAECNTEVQKCDVHFALG